MPEFNRQLTPEELQGFWNRHPFAEFPYIPDMGKYIRDDELGGYVLIFQKQDGDKLYILTETDPSISDPSTVGYVLRETLNAVGENTEQVFSTVGTGFKWTVPVVVGLVLIVFRNEVKDILKIFTK